MIPPSDLNRFPRWIPARQSEEVLRYARLELGSEALVRETRIRATQPLRGIRLWMASHLPFARTRASAVRAERLGSNLAAVHFQGESSRASRDAHGPGEEPILAFATTAMSFRSPGSDDCPDERAACDH